MCIYRLREIDGDVLLFTSGHFIRVLAARWIGLEPTANARRFMLGTASLSALGYEEDMSRPVIRLWNETRHVDGGDCEEVLTQFAKAGIDVDVLAGQFQEEVAKSYVKSWNDLLQVKEF